MPRSAARSLCTAFVLNTTLNEPHTKSRRPLPMRRHRQTLSTSSRQHLGYTTHDSYKPRWPKRWRTERTHPKNIGDQFELMFMLCPHKPLRTPPEAECKDTKCQYGHKILRSQTGGCFGSSSKSVTTCDLAACCLCASTLQSYDSTGTSCRVGGWWEPPLPATLATSRDP